jgi:hypothetical protein
LRDLGVDGKILLKDYKEIGFEDMDWIVCTGELL